MKTWEDFLRVDGWGSEYPSVDVCLRHYSRKIRSESTKRNFAGAVERFCKYAGLEPEELVSLSPEEASRIVQDYVDSLRDRNLSIRHINSVLAFLRIFFKLNGFKNDRAIEVEQYHQPARYSKREQHVPMPDEIYRMGYSAGSKRNRVVIFSLYTTGLRNSTLRALQYGDVKEELEEGLDIVKIPIYPNMKSIDPKACKGNIPYYTFLGKEAVESLRDYLDDRRKKQGGIEDDEILFCAEADVVPPQRRPWTPMSDRSLQIMVKRAARKAGIKKWKHVTPKSLRPAFEFALRNARLDVKDQEFLMGHILPGSQDAYYDHTKVGQLRRKYAMIDFFPKKASSEEMRKIAAETAVKILEGSGWPEEKIKRVEEALAKYETVDEALEEIRKLGKDSYKAEETIFNGGINVRFQSKVVALDELTSHINEGWEYLANLVDNRFLIRRPK